MKWNIRLAGCADSSQRTQGLAEALLACRCVLLPVRLCKSRKDGFVPVVSTTVWDWSGLH